ncbi:MAG: hypothetical protein ABUL58_01970 [Steroidobacter sp.]
MFRYVCVLAWMLYAGCCWSDELTATEMKWLRAGWPVLEYAESQQLPIDIIAQPEARPGDVPFAMAVENGRCQLVLSMRGNPDAEATLANIPAEQVDLVIEAMTAHEVAHCWRYAHGIWHTLPAGFVEKPDAAGQDNKITQLKQQIRETRREEGFADLVALTWTLREHPEHYAEIHAWLEQVRKDQPVTGAQHDTRVWIQLAKDSSIFEKGKSPFEQAGKVWSMGLIK